MARKKKNEAPVVMKAFDCPGPDIGGRGRAMLQRGHGQWIPNAVGGEPKIVGGRMAAKAYEVLDMAINHGVMSGLRRCCKYGEQDWSEEDIAAMSDKIEGAVMTAILEWFQIERVEEE